MIRKVCWAMAIVTAIAGGSVVRAAETPHVKGLWLTTDYPSITARAGETTTIKLKLQNYDLPPERVALSIDVPNGWKATILGAGTPVGAAMPGSNDNVPLSLRVDVPSEATAGVHQLLLHAKGSDASADLPIDIAIGEDLPAQLSIKAKLPSVRGSPSSSFEYQFTVKNDGDKDLLVKLAAEAPQGFQTTFTEAYGSQELSSVPIEAGKDKDIKVKVQPPSEVTADDYPVMITASAEGVSAQTELTMQVTGQPKIGLSGDNGRLSAQAEAGSATPINLVVSNDGTAPATNIQLSGSPPSDWKVEFRPDKIQELAPTQKVGVQALLTPSAKTIAGDYMTTFRASGKGDSSSADFRISVATSTAWGLAGVAIIAIALLVAVGAVARYGRR